MYWNPVKFFHFRPISLVTKLMLFYSLSTVGILSAISLFLYPTFIKIVSQINRSQASHITTECYEKIILALLFASLSGILIGYIIARKGLKRLREFENKMEKMTVDSLHERINLADWPKELSSLANKFNMMLNRIESSFFQVSQFSSDIAHELRTPLHNLRFITELALSKDEYDEKYKILLEKYMDEYSHLSKLIENLLFFSRSDNGQMTLHKEMLNANNEILNICDYYIGIAEENNTQIICEGEGSVFADPTLFKRVISNLLLNALHYSKNGEITILIQNMNQYTKISIHDTGIGIPKEHLPKIFDRFYRVDSSRSSQSGGLGLGLSIVKSIIELHKGKITIESEINKGTTVYLEMPLF